MGGGSLPFLGLPVELAEVLLRVDSPDKRLENEGLGKLRFGEDDVRLTTRGEGVGAGWNCLIELKDP